MFPKSNMKLNLAELDKDEGLWSYSAMSGIIDVQIR